MKLVSAYDAAMRLGWNFREWSDFVLRQVCNFRPAETEAGRMGIPLKLPCGLVVTLTPHGKSHLIDKVLEESIKDAVEWDAKRRLGLPPSDTEIEVDGKLFKVLIGDADSDGDKP